MAVVQDFIDQYRKLLILQYSNLDNATGEIDLLSGSMSKIYDFLNSFFDEFDIDQAYGDRLDIIGRIVGINRIVAGGLAKKYFGFSGITNALNFGMGPFFRITYDSGFTSTQLNDTQYRFFIRAKIAKNVTSAYMVSDEKISLQETIQFIFNNQGFVTDLKNMFLAIYVTDLFPAEDLLLLLASDLIPKPQGVGIKYIASYVPGATFGFSNNPNAVGFGQGVFSRIL